MGDHFKGAERIQQIIHQIFQRDEEVDNPRSFPIVVGAYGVGGSGKTTLCKFMLNFYNKKLYPGNCFFLQFPSREEDENQLIVQSVKDVLSSHGDWTKQSLDKINSVEQAMPLLQELLKSNRVFLVLDNVWNWSLQRAIQIVTMEYMRGSRLLVTARSKHLLQNLSSRGVVQVTEGVERLGAMEIVHVPSISEEEAIEVLMAYTKSKLKGSSFTCLAEDLQGLARWCFFGEQCHPMLLRAVGAQMRSFGLLHTTEIISRLQGHDDEEIEETVLKVLMTSLDADHLKNTFLSLGTCVPKLVCEGQNSTIYKSSEWLSKLRYGSSPHENIRDEIEELEYRGLIQIHKGDVVIHDLQMELIESIVQGNAGAPRCFFFEGDVATLSVKERGRLSYTCGYLEECTDLKVLSDGRRLRYICGYLEEDTDWKVLSESNFPGMEVLCLQQKQRSTQRSALLERQQILLKHMQSLRHLELNNIRSLKELGGWNGAPNLVSVTLTECCNLQKIESMACLLRLESLAIKYCMRYRYNQYELDLVTSGNLKRLVIQGCQLASVYYLKHANLQELELSECENLEVFMWMPGATSLKICNLAGTGICYFEAPSTRVLDLSRCESLIYLECMWSTTALEELYLSSCPNLRTISNLTGAVKLRRLEVEDCYDITEVIVGEAALTNLESLGLQGDCSLEPGRLLAISMPMLEIRHFRNLRTLFWVGGRQRCLFMGGYMLPESLQGLILCGFESLEEVIGLRHLPNLVSLDILACPLLREVGDWEAPFISNLTSVYIEDCPSLQSLSTMRYLTSLKSFSLQNCSMVQIDALPRGVKQFHDWD